MKKFFNSATIEVTFTLVAIFVVLTLSSANATAETVSIDIPPYQQTGEALSTMYSGSNLIRYTEQDLTCLISNIYFEARNQSRKGQLMVASATLTRVTLKQYPNTICAVVKHNSRNKNGSIKKGCAFSWVCDTKTQHKEPTNNIDHKAWRKATKVAIYALKHDTEVLKDNVTHYHTKAIKPSWSAHMAVVGIFDDHIAYSAL